MVSALMMLETMFAAELLGIDAFAAKKGKVLTRQYLSARVSSTGRRS
ncbi:hypothetical protein [Reyranella sp.]|nr:hypothetical protein [Reyranella sp.]